MLRPRLFESKKFRERRGQDQPSRAKVVETKTILRVSLITERKLVFCLQQIPLVGYAVLDRLARAKLIEICVCPFILLFGNTLNYCCTPTEIILNGVHFTLQELLISQNWMCLLQSPELNKINYGLQINYTFRILYF